MLQKALFCHACVFFSPVVSDLLLELLRPAKWKWYHSVLGFNIPGPIFKKI